MEAGVFLLQGDDTLVRMVERPYEAESLLQLLLAAHPDRLAGDLIDPANPRRWLLVEREAGVPASLGGTDWWAVDHLFLDQDATPTFVEVKRAADTRARREVVAQMLDYAANATEYWPVDRMRELFALRCAAMGIDPAEALREVVGPEADEAAFWELAKSNLRDGRVRLLFVADRIPPSLRRIVEFLNRQMTPAEVLAVEIRQFAPGSDAPLRTLVPRVIGQTEQARTAKAMGRPPGRSQPIARQEFLDLLGDDRRDVALAVLQAAAASGFVASEYRSPSGSAASRLTLAGVRGTPVTLYPDSLWVSLGRYHPALREPAANREIRQAILRVAPFLKTAEDPSKSEVGIPLGSIEAAGRDHLDALFGALKSVLAES
jgi:hypothetical protein